MARIDQAEMKVISIEPDLCIFSLCHMIPGFSKLLLPRINPFVLVAYTGALALIVVHILIDMK